MKMMNRVKNFVFYGGLTKDTYKNVRSRINDENRVSNNIFTVLGAFAFLITALTNIFQNQGVHSAIYYSGVGIFILMFFVNLTLSKKFPIVSDIISVAFSAILLVLGILIAYGQKDQRTTMLLPLFALVSLVFCYRPIYLIVILVTAEIVYICIMKNVQTSELFMIDLINTVIFSFIGLVGGLYVLAFKHKKHKADYENQVLLERDVLTGLLNRYSWNKEFEKIEKDKSVVTICSLDVNGLKKTNDSKGHLAGDELIIGAATCIKDVFDEYGNVYRIGGDEFSVIIYKDIDVKSLCDELNKKTESWKGKMCDELSVSLGVAKLDNQNITSINKALHLADQHMYSEKKKYHMEHDEKE